MAWGTLIHGLLEHAMRHKAATRDDLRRLAMWLTVEEPQLRPVIDEALDTVRRVATQSSGRLREAESTRRRCPFRVPGAGLRTGVIDLLFETKRGWRIVDYKTDRSLEDGRYAAQLDAYRHALASAGCSVSDASIVSVRHEQDTATK